ncbi:Guanine nucleotide-binding protein [Dioscorea alata]|uniref:Guanine nucleotide-binding protein n=2 Tax=Dioscorea alata TaxID=55571 RepID=A0ACB7TUH3_DIOAL|nr:Guanine nucleotide-binding protein [Dioscorea alata]KAH7650725.1 Guanine nucleotide-binding protein [Dioscorea alata]
MTVERREEEEDPSQQSTDATAVWPFLRFDSPPRKIYHFFQQFRNRVENPSNYNNFLKGVKWSPDGTCFLTSCDDNTIRLFHLPEEASYIDQLASDYQDSYHSNLVINEAEMVYDYCWYPYMCSSDPTSSVFVATTRDHPIHLWDATSGQLRCTYRAYNDMDEITAALSVSFNSSGTKLFAGYNKMLRVFDVHRPGRDFQQFSLHKGKDGPSGIVSSIAVSPSHSGMLALGSYNQSTALYAEDNMELLYVLHGQSGGITQDSYILCWDVRNTVDIVYKLYRSTENTNQRVSFDIEPCGRHLGAGGEDGLVHIYDLQSGQWITAFQAASDTVNGFGFHPHLPLAASSSGNRRFSLPDNFEENWNLRGDENCASIWTFG